VCIFTGEHWAKMPKNRVFRLVERTISVLLGEFVVFEQVLPQIKFSDFWSNRDFCQITQKKPKDNFY